MTQVWQLLLALSFPIVCLLMVLWLSYLEETLLRDVSRARRLPEPKPILRVAVRALPPAQAPEVSRSVAASLGGSTNR